MMIVLGVVAALLCALKLGPILMGAPVSDPGKAKKKPAGDAATATAKTPAQPAPAKRAGSNPPARPPRGQPAAPPTKKAPDTPTSNPAPAPLSAVRIDFSAVQPRTFTFSWTELRDPFAPASFELVNPTDALAMSKLKLQGVVQSGNRRLAIIGNRVYREGQEVIRGVRLLAVDGAGVLLSDGDHKIRLSLDAPVPKPEGL